ncbi:DUF411 domain-containing protein [Methylomarinum roseum]|nr:DUF411 domain-containing protein [Methylomarinum sp. Ch1-1]MDP4522122.1 DUF411 domain-containing protein [Methylomarinum sp. Ch1-1]
MNIFKITLFSLLLFISFVANSESQNMAGGVPEIVVYRSPTCGCCGKWVQHLRDQRFKIKDVVSDDMQAIKDKYGVPREMASCHTAVIDGYVIEGHVPARDIKRLLEMKPDVVGISVPGMPVGTPGMEMGGRKDPYQVISFDKEGRYRVFDDY